MAAYALTTNDNPFDPFDDFKAWFQFDTLNHYNCCNQVAVAARTSDQLTDEENERAIEEAIDSIIETDFLHIYKKVKAK